MMTVIVHRRRPDSLDCSLRVATLIATQIQISRKNS